MHIKNEIQLKILRQLLFKSKARFRDLNMNKLPNDHFSFHIKKLLKIGIIKKTDNFYELTSQGLEIAGRLDLKTLKEIRQPKVGICLVIIRERNGKKEILIEKRLKDPLKGKVGFHTSKVNFGETLSKAAKRALKNETGLHGSIEYIGVQRIIRMKNNYPVIDVLLNFFRVKDPKGTLIKDTMENNNFWVDIAEVNQLKNTYKNFKKDLVLVFGKKFFLKEKVIKM